MNGPGESAPGRAPRTGTRARVIDAAARLYQAQGDAATTIEAIADAAGVSPSAVYRYFGGKRDLEQAMVDEALSRAEVLFAEARLAPSPIERVRAAGAAYFRVAVEFPVATRFFADGALRSTAPGPSQAFERAVTQRTQQLAAGVSSDLREAMDADEIPSARVADVLVFLWGAWGGVIAVMLRRDTLAADAESAARALALGERAMLLAIDHLRSDPHAAPAVPAVRPASWPTVSPPPSGQPEARDAPPPLGPDIS